MYKIKLIARHEVNFFGWNVYVVNFKQAMTLPQKPVEKDVEI